MAAYASLLYVWKFQPKVVRCYECRQKIRLVTDNRGKTLPFALTATPLREQKTDRGTFEVYEPTAFHTCPAKKAPAKKRRALKAPSLFSGASR